MAGLAEFMDRHASRAGDFETEPVRSFARPGGRPPAECGPSSARIARAARTRRFGEQMLAALFWWCYVRSDDFPASRVVPRYAESLADQRQILVSHDDGARWDLLILAPGVPAPAGARVTPVPSAVRPGLAYSQSAEPDTIAAVALDEADRMGAMLARAGIDVDARAAVLAVTELAREGDFHLVIAPPPAEAPTGGPGAAPFCAPSPALAVTIDGEPRPVATAGVIGTDDAGRLLVTTARHVVDAAVAASAKIMVGGAPATIVGPSHELTDSCVLAVACQGVPGAGTAGPLHRPPVLYMPATFAGAASGAKQTRIISFDISVVSPTPFSGGRVYTDPDTIPGDSGAALVDSDDHIVGFAVGRTAFGAPLEFSTWSWAEQVLAAHGLG
jgi:hypothetical protein